MFDVHFLTNTKYSLQRRIDHRYKKQTNDLFTKLNFCNGRGGYSTEKLKIPLWVVEG